ncbi:MAG: helix-turn-helix domain-containing protein, partial [Gammaproteobacteria bacterium]
INVIELRVPSLRERPQDIPLLADYNLDRLARSAGAPKPMLTKDALDALLDYSFPGNVRELENILERAMTLCEGSAIDVDDLRLPDYTPSPDKEKLPLEPYLDTIEKETIMKALEQTRYNKTAAAKLLGITFRALRYRLKKLGLD